MSLSGALNSLVSLFDIAISSEYLKTDLGGTSMVLTTIICVLHSIRKQNVSMRYKVGIFWTE